MTSVKALPLHSPLPIAETRILCDRDLLKEFVSLGFSTELGFVQRACGAEPLSLFRFMHSRITSLCHALETRLEHLFVADDLEVYADHGEGRYHCRSRFYDDFLFYAFADNRHVTVEEITERERNKVGYLRRQLLDDLETGDKIFVRTGYDPSPDLRRMRRALSAYGERKLLLVSVADVEHLAGAVAPLDQDAVRGFVSGFKVCLRPEAHDVANWLVVLRATHRMLRADASHRLPQPLAAGSAWQFAERDEITTLRKLAPAAGFRRRNVFRIKKAQSVEHVEDVASCEVSLDGLRPTEMVVFSAWVQVPAGFVGRLFVSFKGLEAKHVHPADRLHLSRWQRIWSSIQVPRGMGVLGVCLRVDGHPCATLDLGEWAFHRGCAPPAETTRAQYRVGRWWASTRRSALLRQARRKFEALEATPASACAFADILIANKCFFEADAVLSEVIATFPDDAALAKAYAISAHNSGRYHAAINRWQTALAANRTDPMCFAGFAGNLREHVALDRAKDVIDSALTQFPSDMMVLTEAARIADEMRQPAVSLPLWEKAIALHGPNPHFVLGRDRARSTLG